MTHHKYGLSALVSQVSFRNERSGVISKCRLFSHATRLLVPLGWAPVFRAQQVGLWNTRKTCWLWCKTLFHDSDDSVIRRWRLAWDKAPWWRKKVDNGASEGNGTGDWWNLGLRGNRGGRAFATYSPSPPGSLRRPILFCAELFTFIPQGPVVRRPIIASPGLNLNPVSFPLFQSIFPGNFLYSF